MTVTEALDVGISGESRSARDPGRDHERQSSPPPELPTETNVGAHLLNGKQTSVTEVVIKCLIGTEKTAG